MVSDHYPVLFEWMEDLVSSPVPFTFNHSGLSNVDFIKMVRAEWPLLSLEVPASGMDDLSLKLRLLKRKVKVWTREKTLEMKEKTIRIEEEINTLLESMSNGLLCSLDNIKLMAL